MTDTFDVPDGTALLCQTCGWRPDENLTVGLVKAHFEVEHDTSEVRLDLVALCPRCAAAMRFTHHHAGRDHHVCDGCRRTRTIRREATA